MHDTSIAGVRLHAPVAVKTSSMVVGCPILKSKLVESSDEHLFSRAKFWICVTGAILISNVAMCSDDDDAMMNAMVITFQAFQQAI